ncbi:hypothetical protein ACLOJK_015733 [Asimina triloba]
MTVSSLWNGERSVVLLYLARVFSSSFASPLFFHESLALLLLALAALFIEISADASSHALHRFKTRLGVGIDCWEEWKFSWRRLSGIISQNPQNRLLIEADRNALTCHCMETSAWGFFRDTARNNYTALCHALTSCRIHLQGLPNHMLVAMQYAGYFSWLSMEFFAVYLFHQNLKYFMKQIELGSSMGLPGPCQSSQYSLNIIAYLERRVLLVVMMMVYRSIFSYK